MRVDIKMPNLGYDVESGKIVRWFKAVGEHVERGEPIAEIDGGKMAVEIEALATGTLVEITRAPGDEAPIGAKIGCIETA